MLITITYDVKAYNISAEHNLVKIGTSLDFVDPCLRNRRLLETLCVLVLNGGLWWLGRSPRSDR